MPRNRTGPARVGFRWVWPPLGAWVEGRIAAAGLLAILAVLFVNPTRLQAWSDPDTSPTRLAVSEGSASDSRVDVEGSSPSSGDSSTLSQPVSGPRGVIRVAHDTHYPPYESVDSGVSQGFGIEVIRQAAKRLGMQVVFVPNPWEGVLQSLRMGLADVTPEMMQSEERRRTWYMGKPWGESWSVVFVQRDKPYRRLKDLWGLSIAVPSGDIEQERLARLKAFKLVPVANTRTALMMLYRGEVEAAACNRDVALHELGQTQLPANLFRAFEEPLAITPFSVAGPPDKSYLVDSLTEAIGEMKKDGSLEALHWRWFLRASDESIRSLEHQTLLRRVVFVLLIAVVVLMAFGFIYYRRQKNRLERLVKRRTKELTRSEQHYRALFDHARDAIFLVNPDDWKITEANSSAEQLSGRSHRKLIGRPIFDLFSPEERHKVRDLFERQCQQEVGSLHAEVNVQRPDGTLLVAQIRAALVRLKEGTTLYAVFRDVTETARARQEIELRNRELRIQNALALELQRDLPLGKLLGAGLDTILAPEGSQIHKRGAVLLLQPGQSDLLVATVRGIDGFVSIEDTERRGEDSWRRASRVSGRKALLDRALKGEMVLIDKCTDEIFPIPASPLIPPHGHYIGPLRSEGRIVGVLCLFTEPGAPTDERRRALLEGLCSQLGIVVESERREQALREREHRLESMYEIAISLGSSLHLAEQLRILFAQIRRVLPTDAGNVWVADTEDFTSNAEVYYSFDTQENGALVESTTHEKSRAVPGTSIYKVFNTGEPLLILRSEQDMRDTAGAPETQFGLERRSRSLLYVPLKFKGRVIGVLTVQSYTPYAFTQETVDVLMSLSAPLAVVIENARLFEAVEERRAQLDQSLKLIEADLRAAQVAQESLLPKDFPNIRGWDFASIFIPSQYVGGDIFNVFRLDDRHFGLYHIDVSGHGVPAALFSVGLNQFLMRDLLGPGVLREPGARPGEFRIRSPEEVVAALDRENMFQKYQRFFTMIYLVADTETGVVRFYRAGHNEPLLLRPGEPPRYLPGGGPLVGFQLPRTRNESQDIQLRPGDRLIVYSDGINEAIDQKGDLYGLDRMAEFLNRADGVNLQMTFNKLVDEVRQFTKTESFEDDVSMVGMGWNPK